MGGGERGIRTPGTTFGSTRDFQSRSLSQLGHLSLISLVLRTGYLCHLSGFWQKNRSPSTSEFLRSAPVVGQWRKATRLLWRRGWDSNPRASLLTRQIDFESTPLRPLRYLSAEKAISSARLSLFRKEGLHQAPALLFQYSVDYLQAVIKPSVLSKIEKGSPSTGFLVESAKNERVNPGIYDGAHTHYARLNRNDQGSPSESVVLVYSSCLPDDHYFRMGGGVSI